MVFSALLRGGLFLRLAPAGLRDNVFVFLNALKGNEVFGVSEKYGRFGRFNGRDAIGTLLRGAGSEMQGVRRRRTL